VELTPNSGVDSTQNDFCPDGTAASPSWVDGVAADWYNQSRQLVGPLLWSLLNPARRHPWAN